MSNYMDQNRIMQNILDGLKDSIEQDAKIELDKAKKELEKKLKRHITDIAINMCTGFSVVSRNNEVVIEVRIPK